MLKTWEGIKLLFSWGIQVFCSRNEASTHFKPPPWTEHLNTLGIISHCTDSFHVKPTTPGHPIPKISTHLFSEGAERQSLWKQSTDKRVHHQKRNQTDCTRNAQLSCEQFYCSSCCCAVIKQRVAWNEHSIDSWKI